MDDRLAQVLDAIDTANRADPVAEPDTDGTPKPRALLYGRRMSAELARLFGGEASDVLQIAARGQHIERWTLPRSDYPEGKAGYLRWRRDQGMRHGEALAGLMADAGYDGDACDRVRALLKKERLKSDPEVQALEDVICFTFMRWYFAPFAAKHPAEKVADIVAKTARKMSNAARERAVAEFALPPDLAELVRPVTL
ncbi:MAG: DUF4202 domain-containing protein [Pseudomonadota bacterium]